MLDPKLRAQLLTLARDRLKLRPDDLRAFETEVAQDRPLFDSHGVSGRWLGIAEARVAALLGDARPLRRELLEVIDEWAERRQPITPLPTLTPDKGERWTPERIREARRMRDRLRRAGHRDYSKRTADHYGVTTTRLREVIGPAEVEHKVATPAWSTPARKVHRLK